MTARTGARGTFQTGGGPQGNPAVPLDGRPFFKMTGSGNDFVFFDNRLGQHEDLVDPRVIGALCDRRSGIGADGVVLISTQTDHAFDMRYYNRDGSLAEMCGNAALCSATLARTLGIVKGNARFSFSTPSGPVHAQFTADGPVLDMNPVTELNPAFETPLEPGELRVGFARVGVPHLVLRVRNVNAVEVVRRGRLLRHLPQLRDGANVNFVSQDDAGHWHMRTYERGVEDETLACGTGTVATVALLDAWGDVEGRAVLATRSGRDVSASVSHAGAAPRLQGEGRLVATGTLGEIPLR